MADGGTKVANPLLRGAPVRPCGFDSALTGGRQTGDTPARIHSADLNPTQATAFQGIEVPSHCGAVERDFDGEARDRQRPEAGERDQDGELRDAEPRGGKSRVVHWGGR